MLSIDDLRFYEDEFRTSYSNNCSLHKSQCRTHIHI